MTLGNLGLDFTMTRRAGAAPVMLLVLGAGVPAAWGAPGRAPAAPGRAVAPEGRSASNHSAAILASLTSSERTMLAHLNLSGPGVDSIIVTARADDGAARAAAPGAGGPDRSPELSDLGLASLLMVLTAAGASLLLRRLTHV